MMDIRSFHFQLCSRVWWVLWGRDFKPLALRPFGYQEVWVGYDPAETGDTAGLVVIAPPLIHCSKSRLLERHQFKGMDFQAQAAYIKKICENYRVTYIGLDTTGMGTGVAQLVRQFFPALTTFSYSAWLNESATLFRRKYYNNGSHAGFILYLTDPQQNEDDVNNLRQAFKDSKGPGNFRNLFLYSPSGKPDGIKLIPVSEVAAKDEFAHIKSITRDDILAAMRTPPQLLGIIPNNTGGFGSITEAEQVHWNSEIIPLQHRIADQVNEWAGQKLITFKSYAEVRGKLLNEK